MVKVFLTSAEGMKTDLLPENINIRKVLAAFGLCADTGRVSVEGKILDGAELDKCLREFVENDSVHVSVVPVQPDAPCRKVPDSEETDTPDRGSTDAFRGTNELKAEHLKWIISADIQEYEKQRILDLMRTGRWLLVWNDRKKAFFLERQFEQVIMLKSEELTSGEAIHWTDKEFADLAPEIRIAILRNVVTAQTDALRKTSEDLEAARKMLFDALDECHSKEKEDTELPF